MKLMLPRIMALLAYSFLLTRIDAAPTPAPTPAQVAIAPPLPANEVALQDKLNASLSPAARDWVAGEAIKAAGDDKMTEGRIRADIQTRFTGQSLMEQDKNILLFIVLGETAKTMADNLSTMVDGFRKKAVKPDDPAAAPAGGATKITLSPADTTLLQTAIQRRTQFMATMSIVMKKISNTQETVVGNLQ
jgi:hypothetical protein